MMEDVFYTTGSILWGIFLGVTFLQLEEQRFIVEPMKQEQLGVVLAYHLGLLVFLVLSYFVSYYRVGAYFLALLALLGWLQLVEVISLTHSRNLANVTGETSFIHRLLGFHRWPWLATLVVSLVWNDAVVGIPYTAMFFLLSQGVALLVLSRKMVDEGRPHGKLDACHEARCEEEKISDRTIKEVNSFYRRFYNKRKKIYLWMIALSALQLVGTFYVAFHR